MFESLKNLTINSSVDEIVDAAQEALDEVDNRAIDAFNTASEWLERLRKNSKPVEALLNSQRKAEANPEPDAGVENETPLRDKVAGWYEKFSSPANVAYVRSNATDEWVEALSQIILKNYGSYESNRRVDSESPYDKV